MAFASAWLQRTDKPSCGAVAPRGVTAYRERSAMTSAGGERFTAGERLCGKDAIRQVFEKGNSARRGRVLARFVFAEERDVPLRVGVAVARGVRRAVDRNRCKRWLREALRREKGELLPKLAGCKCAVDVMLVWTDTSVARSAKLFPDTRQSVHDLFFAIASRIPA
jgi:ribonuclease P protein component